MNTLKVEDMIKLLSKMPKDYELTYSCSIGHVILSENQVSVFNDTKEILLQTHMIK